MAETQTWTRRGSNPKLEQEVIDIPPTPTGEGKYGAFPVSQTITTALTIAAWYSSNIGVLLLNKYLLSFFGYRYPIFLTMLHMCACSIYSFLAISWLEIVLMQFIVSRR